MENIISINISALFGTDQAARETVDAQIVEAIRTHGAFVIAGFPRAEEIDALAARMVNFFELNEAEKFRIAKACSKSGSANKYRGYESHLQPGGRFAFNEMYDIGPKSPSPAPTEGTQLFAETNVWPEPEPSPGWRQAMEDYHETLHLVAMAVLHSVGRSVGLPAENLDQMFRTGNSTLRLINYPVPPEGLRVETQDADDSELKISTACHTDGSGLSILWSLQRGLQARSPDGTWRDVPQQANCLSIHLGDVIAAISGGRIPATPHRVVGHGIARQSIGFFLEPRLDVPLNIADPASVDGGFRDTYGWLLQKRFSGYENYAGIVEPPD